MTDAPAAPVAFDPVPADAADVADWLRASVPAGASLTADSRRIAAGDAFFAFPGQRDDGRRFLPEAIGRGARAVVMEADGADAFDCGTLPTRRVAGLRGLAGPIASAYHGRPSERLSLVAVTGTNGKTSTTQWIAHGLSFLGRSAAVVGTLGSGVVGRLQHTGLTTPDALGLQALLAEFAAQGVGTVAAEASSIGLDQGRLNGSRVAVAAFTNLTRDHLDYHGTMEAYAAAKARLFAWPGLQAVVVNGDDPAALQMLSAVAHHAPGGAAPRRIVYGFAPGQFGARGDAALIAERAIEELSGIRLDLAGDFGRAQVRLNMLGRFNVSNALAAAACWLSLGLTFDQVVAALESLSPVRGRMQTLERANGPLAVVDYAHSPDALANVLASLRPVALMRGGLLWCVFGAGGDRDAGKRPMMGFVAERGADRLVITSDNPRSESPFRIVSDIRAGLSREPALTELDRASAIRAALERAAAADVVLIAGKGHESWQEIGSERLPFSDVEVAEAALEARSAAAAARDAGGDAPAPGDAPLQGAPAGETPGDERHGERARV